MKYKAGDRVRIRSKEWMDAQEKDAMGFILISTESGDAIVPTMQKFAGKLAKISGAFNGIYRLDIDNQDFTWEEWMFDPEYKADEPLSAEDAIIAIVQDGETLYDANGMEVSWDSDNKQFMYRGNGRIAIINNSFSGGLYRSPLKCKRPMTRWEVLAWANSEASRGWVVRNNSYLDNDGWSLPQYYSYDALLETYRRARLLPDLSGIDESTIQGFEVEE